MCFHGVLVMRLPSPFNFASSHIYCDQIPWVISGLRLSIFNRTRKVATTARLVGLGSLPSLRQVLRCRYIPTSTSCLKTRTHRDSIVFTPRKYGISTMDNLWQCIVFIRMVSTKRLSLAKTLLLVKWYSLKFPEVWSSAHRSRPDGHWWVAWCLLGLTLKNSISLNRPIFWADTRSMLKSSSASLDWFAVGVGGNVRRTWVFPYKLIDFDNMMSKYFSIF